MEPTDLAQLARDDVVSAAALRLAGHGASAVADAVRSGALVPLIRGWYAVRPPRDDRDGHWLRTVAALRRYDLRAAASHTSLVIAQGLPDYRLDLSTVHLTRASPGVSRRGGEVRIHRPIGVDLTGRDRVPTAIRVVQAGLEGVPLSALVAADAALHRRLVTTDELAEACAVLAGCRGIGPVRAILREADARIESPGESIVGHRLRALGYVLIPQFPVVTDDGEKFADFGIRGTRVLVEFDGAEKYATKSAGFAEKRREDAMRRRGHFFARFVWAELDDVALIAARTAGAIADSRRWRG
jgi:hypothetical protein